MLDLWSRKVPSSELPVLYDQGPYFTLAFAHWLHGRGFESRRLRAWHQKYSDQTSQLLDLVIRLESSDTVLRERLTTRSQDHFVKQAGKDAQNQFLETSRRDLDRVGVEGSGEPRFCVIMVRSDDVGPTELAARVEDLIEGRTS
jgi:hypothetical protein